MIIRLEDARECYDAIIKEAKKINGKIVIFVGFDIDSICTLRILVALFRGDLVRYEIVPVMNYRQLDLKMAEFEKGYKNNYIGEHNDVKDIRAFILINCGGTRDLSQMWFCEDQCKILCLLIDVHRPSHHNNINSQNCDRVIVIDDGHYDIENCPKEEDMDILKDEGKDELEYEYMEREREDESEIEGEEEIGNQNDRDDLDNLGELDNQEANEEEEEFNSNPKKRMRIKKKKANLDTINEEDEREANLDPDADEIDQIINQVKPKKTKKSALIDEKLLKLGIRRKKRAQIRNYYAGNYFGFPAAYVAYKMATQLFREDTQILWLLIVAITEHYLRAHINQKMYDELYSECHSEVLRLNKVGVGAGINGNNSALNSQNRKERRDRIKKEEGLPAGINQPIIEEDSNLIEDKYELANVKVKTVNKDAKTITIDPDYRLFLYRHWNLHDSIIYSNYTSAHLRTWGEPGKEEVKKLFTYMGVPLNEARQKYTYMNNDFKTIFKDKVPQVSSIFHLKDLVFNSFIYQFNQITQLSASDFVYCVSALLEYPFPLSSVEGSNSYLNDDDLDTATSYDEDKKDHKDNYMEDEKEMRSHYKFDNFWASYDFLSLKADNMVKVAIDLAIKFQMAMVRNGTLILNKKAVNGNKNFRYAFISYELEESKYFQHPINLEKLALYIMDTYHVSKPDYPKKPFLLALLNKSTKKYLVGGVLGNARRFDQDKCDFALRFRVTSNKRGADIMLNNFDECIIEIAETDFHAFMEEVSQI